MNVGILLLRLAVGLTVGMHGLAKLTARFGGHGVQGTSQFLGSLGFRPARFYTYLLGIAELVGGLLLAAGLLTPLAALMVIGVMTAAIAAVHWSNGFFATNNGIELPFVLGAAAVAIAFVGPGAYSLDSLLDLPVTDDSLAVAAVVLGVLVGLGVAASRHLSKGVRVGGPQTQS